MRANDWETLADQVLVTAAALLVVLRLPRHPVGWLLTGFAAVTFLGDAAAAVAEHQLAAPASNASAPYLAAFSEAAQRPVIGLSLALLLVFPDGRLLSRRWRPLAAGIGVLFPLWFVLHLLMTNPLEEDPFQGLPNPFAIPGLTGSPVLVARWLFLPVVAVLAAGVAVSVVLRFGRSADDERQQLKIVGLAFSGVVLGLVALAVTGAVAPDRMNAVGTVFSVFLWTLLPLAVVVAMCRYRLYDIDLLINRTIVYGLLSVAVIATYAFVVVTVGPAVTRLGWRSPVTISLATLAAAFLIEPGRRRIQRAVDRQFSRREFDAVAMVEAFTRGERDALRPISAVTELLGAALADPTVSVAFWLRDQKIYADGDGDAVHLPAPGTGRAVTVVGSAAEPVAVLIHDPALERTPAVLSAVVNAAILVLENARLRAEAAVQVAEVRRSRARIVEAADTERQRVERDLHDGAQQRLVALALRLKLAERASLTSAAPSMTELVSFTVDELNATVADLRELARGIAPESLSEEGLGAALDGIAARIPTPVVVSVPPRRFSPAVERTLYYAACEAITNAVKHASPGMVTVTVCAEPQQVRLTVGDDGCGGADPDRGSGLRGLIDRIEAAGGRLHLTSIPGAGTVVEASVPCTS